MTTGERFSFIVDQNIAGRMDRVVLINDGRVISKVSGGEGVAYEVERT